MGGNNASGLASITGVLLVWATLIFGVRIWVKTRLRTVDFWGHDDTFVSISFIVIIAQVASTFHAISLGYGAPWPDLSVTVGESIQQLLYAGQILYICAIGCTRLSTCLFTARLSRHRRHRNATHLWTAISFTITATSILVIAIRGNLSHPWTTLDGSEIMYYRWLGVEMAGLALDFCVFATASTLIWGLHMPVLKRLMVSAVFSTRLLIIPIIVFRLLHLRPDRSPSPLDTSAPAPNPQILTQASLHISFILATVTCLKPFLRPFHEGHLITASGSANASGYAKQPSYNGVAVSSGGPRHYQYHHKASEYVKLSTPKDCSLPSAGKHGKATLAVTISERDTQAQASAAQRSVRSPSRAFVPDTHGRHRSVIEPGGDAAGPSEQGNKHSDRRDKSRERERTQRRSSTGSEEAMIINKTQTWTVEFEERGDVLGGGDGDASGRAGRDGGADQRGSGAGRARGGREREHKRERESESESNPELSPPQAARSLERRSSLSLSSSSLEGSRRF